MQLSVRIAIKSSIHPRSSNGTEQATDNRYVHVRFVVGVSIAGARMVRGIVANEARDGSTPFVRSKKDIRARRTLVERLLSAR